jgi:uncharacterized NAD(P)/FAD-binding protein YdhS
MSAARPHAMRVAVIGAGAAGTLTAVHLMRQAEEAGRQVEVSLIDATGQFGPGVAYGTEDPLHLLNIPAGRMGGIGGQPGHFRDWLSTKGMEVGEADFVPRHLYGAYLRDLLSAAETARLSEVSLVRVAAEVVGIEVPAAVDEPLKLILGDKTSVETDRVVLALGPPRGGDPVQIPEALREDAVYVANPWIPGALDTVKGDRNVLIIGTGLTTIDVSLSLASLDDGPRMRAVSRHGLLPRRHRRDLTRIQRFPVPLEDGRLEPVVTAVFEEIDRVAKEGRDWRDVLDSLRLSTPEIWRALRPEEKIRFYSSLERLWQVHRFRMAPPVADRLDELLRLGILQTDARTVLSVEPQGRGARVSLGVTGRDDPELIDVDRVINCSGPGAKVEPATTPLLRDLLKAGNARVDQIGIGLDVEPEGALVDASGKGSARIRVVGALRKGVEWESLGVGEIRDQAVVVARNLLGETDRRLQTV